VAKKTNRPTSRIEGIIDDVIGKNPHSRGIITAFKPLLLVRERLIGELKLKPADPSRIDGEKLRQGIPCIEQTPFFSKDDPWDRIGLAVLTAIGEGFPALAKDAAKLGKKIEADEIRLFDAFEDYPASAAAAADRWAGEAGIKPQAIDLLLGAVARIIIQARSNGIGGHIEGMGWDGGTCPVCGAHPTISVIREKITQRWLHCSRCGHEWRFTRMLCPGCGKESPSGIDYFYVDDRKQDTAFTCDACKRYLITLNHVSDLGDTDRDVTAMGLIHLDLIMQEKGFAPMTRCEWNTF
jgi:FdhE protein